MNQTLSWNVSNETYLGVAETSKGKFTSTLIWMTIIGVVGVFSNSVALYVLTKSKKIRKSQSYILIMNQSLIDLVCSVQTFIWIAVWLSTDSNDKSGAFDWFICAQVRTQFMIASVNCSSSYNLAVLSMERMFSIVKPIFHRVSFNRDNQKIVSVIIWILGTVIMLGFNIPTNGIDENGRCYFWSNFPSKYYARFYALSLVFLYNVLPILIMVISYVLIYGSIGNFRKGNTDVKSNIVRTLAMCVIGYIGCHTLRSTLSVATRFSSKKYMMGGLYQIGMLLMQVNSIINPFIYMLQYKDYRNELKHQLSRLLQVDSNSVKPSTVDNTTLSVMS